MSENDDKKFQEEWKRRKKDLAHFQHSFGWRR